MNNAIRKIYLYKIFDNFMLIYPLYSVMFAARGHLDTLQISTLFIVWTIAGLVFEIPTGALADRHSRRRLLAIGECIRGAGYVAWLLWPTYAGFALGFILWGIGEALDSGTFQALVFDELKAQGREREYAGVIGRTESLSLLIGLGATLLAGPVLARFGYGGVITTSVAATLAAAAVALSLPRSKHQQPAESPSYVRIIREAAREIARNPSLLQIIGFGILLATLYGVLDEYSPLFARAAGVPTNYIPVVLAAMYAPAISAGLAAQRFARLRSFVFMCMAAAAGMALFAAGKFLGEGGIFGFVAFLLLIKLSEIVYGAKLQHGIAGHTRSTMTSINQFGVSIAAIIAYTVFGFAAKTNGMSGALELFGLATSAAALLFLGITHGRFPLAKNAGRVSRSN